MFGQGMEIFSRYNKLSLIEEGYEKNPYVKACGDLYSRGVASLPIKVTVRNANGARTTATEHPILDLLNRSEGGRQGLIEKYALYFAITGDSYMQLVTNDHELREDGTWEFTKINNRPTYEDGIRPLELIVWPSQHINPIQGNVSMPIMGYKFRDYGTASVPAWEIIHWKTSSLREYWHGFPPLTPLGTVIDLSNNYFIWNLNTARREGRPNLVVEADGGVDPESRADIKKYWAEKIGGALNRAQEIPVLAGGAKLMNPNLAPAEMEWLAGDKHVGRIIAMGMKVPSELINDAQNKTYSNMKEAEKAFYLRTLIPDAQKMYSVLNNKLAPFYKDAPQIEVDLDAVDAIQETLEKKTDKVIKQRKARLISLEEAREELDFGAPSDKLIAEQDGKVEKSEEEIKEEIRALMA